MKIQELAIIFIIIILPISLLLSEYTQFQIQTIALQSEYDTRLTAATYDAIRAFQLNANNSSTSDMANSKMRDLEASIATFRNSVITGFGLNGYTEEDLNNYIPALVYTLYDGFYIYSPYENTHDESGNRISGGESIYGLKPYINYSCRYVKGNIDVVITYALDNHITVQGKIGEEFVNKSGYLIEGITVHDNSITYNGVEIKYENLKENLLGKDCSYAKIDGTKYYLIEDYTDDGKDCIVYSLNGTLLVQYDEDDEEFFYWKNKIINNDNAKLYYKEAYDFTNWFKNESNLGVLTYADAIDEEIDKEGITRITNVWGDNNTLIFNFDSGTNIENELSNFNQHRLAVIRHKIETNLAIAISNYNSYSNSYTNVFQMPELKENEWDSITHNISLISFLQGLHIGGKVYNGYTLVTNSESEEVVLENSIYILGQDDDSNKSYHKIGDKGLEDGALTISSGQYGGTSRSAGRLNLDFEKSIVKSAEQTYTYYPLEGYRASYDSIVMQNNFTTFDDIYGYVNKQSYELKEAFYTALGRERVGKYKNNIFTIVSKTTTNPYDPDGYESVDGTTIYNGYIIKDSSGNEFTWVEVPRASEVYKTAGLNITQFTEAEFKKIENDLKNYTAEYSQSNYKDEYSSKEATGMTYKEYYTQKRKMLKSIYKNGGFFIGRYETGIDYAQGPRTSSGNTIQTPVIKQNAYPYNFVSVSQAQSLSQNFVIPGYTASLMFDMQWDLTLKYLETRGTAQEEIITDSSMWGNFSDNLYEITDLNVKYTLNEWLPAPVNKITEKAILLTTGASEKFSKQNISDLAGNCWEWTLGYSSNKNEPNVRRGGEYYYTGKTHSASVHGRDAIDGELYKSRGFRVALYTDEEVGFVPDAYTILYDANGGTGAPSAQTKIENKGLTLSTVEPAREGYIFKGWSSSKTGTVEYLPGATYTKNGNATLYAVWDILKYTISYDANGGTGAPSVQTKVHGTDLTLSTTKPSKNGYTFKGWSTSKTGTVEYQPGNKYTKDENATLYAVWDIAKYTISYDANGGTGAPSAQTKTHGVDITISTTKPSKVGSTFKGWSTSQTGAIEYQPGDKYTKDGNVTLYAVWDLVKYTISYNANGGTGAPSAQTKTHGIDITIPTTNPNKVGYTFKGWSTSRTGTIEYQPGDKYTKNENTTLYAIYTVNTYKITYYYKNPQATNYSYQQENVTYGNKVTIKNAIQTYGGYTFKGWSTSETSTTIKYTANQEITYNQTSNISLYAIYTPNTYYIQYKYKDPSSSSSTYETRSVPVVYGNEITILGPAKVYEGYKFNGWSISAGATSISYTGGEKMVYKRASNMILYAVYTAANTITYNASPGYFSGGSTTITQRVGATATIITSRPVRPASSYFIYTFRGWDISGKLYYPGATITGISGNITARANYTMQIKSNSLQGNDNGNLYFRTYVTNDDDSQYIPIMNLMELHNIRKRDTN